LVCRTSTGYATTSGLIPHVWKVLMKKINAMVIFESAMAWSASIESACHERNEAGGY
jgi:hypothetical protein